MAATHALSALTLGPVCAEQGARRNASFVAASIPAASKKTSKLCLPSIACGGGAPRGRLQIRCARVGGVEIPNAKRVETSLKYTQGVGGTTARQILLDVGIENKITKELSEEELTTIRDERRFNQMAIKRLKDIQCYRGKRHQAGLPCRGQHTKCNARTLRGKKIAIAGKEKAPK